jgi:hypothetical protein
MTADRIFFLAFRGQRGPEFALYYDLLPSKEMLRALPPVAYRYEITGTPWSAMSLSEIVAEYVRRRNSGNLPADNTIRPPAAKPKEERRLGYREKPWTVGDLALQK